MDLHDIHDKMVNMFWTHRTENFSLTEEPVVLRTNVTPRKYFQRRWVRRAKWWRSNWSGVQREFYIALTLFQSYRDLEAGVRPLAPQAKINNYITDAPQPGRGV